MGSPGARAVHRDPSCSRHASLLPHWRSAGLLGRGRASQA